MSDFVKDHVTRIFVDAGYQLLELWGDRGGIVQGDGLHLVVTPDISAAARRFSDDQDVVALIEQDAEASNKLKLSLYGGSSSCDREGIWLSDDFIAFLKDETSGLYYAAQKDVDAIFEAEDAPDREWAGDAYVGVIDQFSVETSDGDRIFVTVKRIADQSFNAYESGDEQADRADAASIISGASSHGSIAVELLDIEADHRQDPPIFDREFSPDAYDSDEFDGEEPSNVIIGSGMIWTSDANEAHTLALAAELAEEEGEHAVAAALKARAIERGLPQDNETTDAVRP
ncbi:hypothetical protein G6L37_07160 [Agrobacterium rubi]|nr:hypothetical protein [Agrobacterium rubi]NTF25145.1 hypothetical protein [Agrobacterium rubi]